MGTIYQRGDVFRATVRKVGQASRSETFTTKREAKAWIRKIETELEERIVTNPKIKIDDLIDQYVKEIAPTRRLAESHLRHDIPSIKKKFKGMTMADLCGRGLIDWALKQPDGVSASTRNWHIARLRGVLRQAEFHWEVAVPWKDIADAQRRLMTMGVIALPKERERRVTDAELGRIKAHLNPDRKVPHEDIIDFCVASAMRIGEVTRIRWDDLDEATRMVVVRDRKHPTKKQGNDQVVALLNGSFEIIMRQKARRKAGEPRIFPHGKLYLSKCFRAAATAAGLDDVVLHDLRHEGISRLFELGFEIQEVALVSGHKEWRTLKRYTHVRPQSLVGKEARLRALA